MPRTKKMGTNQGGTAVAPAPQAQKIKIMFNGREVEVTPVQPGVVQKTPSIYYIQDSISKEWLYCFPQRLERLREKYNNDLSHFKGRATRAEEREHAVAAKMAGRPADVSEVIKATEAAEKAIAHVKEVATRAQQQAEQTNHN